MTTSTTIRAYWDTADTDNEGWFADGAGVELGGLGEGAAAKVFGALVAAHPAARVVVHTGEAWGYDSARGDWEGAL